MNAAIIYSLLAVSFYALEIAITDWKLAHISPRILTLCYALGVAIFAFFSLINSKPGTIQTPHGKEWMFIILMAMASFIAANAHFSALNKHTGAVTLTLFYSLLPVVASLYMYLFTGELPTWRLIFAWVLATGSIIVVVTAHKPA